MTDSKYSDIEMSADRLRVLVRKTLNGGCKLMSLGDGCTCGLCDIDRLVRMAYVGRNAESAVVSAFIGGSKEKV